MACMTCESGAEGVVSVGRTGGGSSGLSSGGAATGGTCRLASRGSMQARSGLGSLSRAVVLRMGAALSVPSLSREQAVSAMMMWALTILLLVLQPLALLNASGLLLTEWGWRGVSDVGNADSNVVEVEQVCWMLKEKVLHLVGTFQAILKNGWKVVG